MRSLKEYKINMMDCPECNGKGELNHDKHGKAYLKDDVLKKVAEFLLKFDDGVDYDYKDIENAVNEVFG